MQEVFPICIHQLDLNKLWSFCAPGSINWAAYCSFLFKRLLCYCFAYKLLCPTGRYHCIFCMQNYSIGIKNIVSEYTFILFFKYMLCYNSLNFLFTVNVFNVVRLITYMSYAGLEGNPDSAIMNGNPIMLRPVKQLGLLSANILLTT